MLILVETELWPWLVRGCRDAGAAVLLVNGRISDRSFPRYRLARPLLKRVLREIDHFCMQTERYADRIRALGAEPSRVSVTGNLKFDVVVPSAESGAAAGLVPPGRPVLVAGSTLAPEEAVVLEAFTQLRKSHPELFLVLAPRHPERFEEVAALVSSSFSLRLARRSQLEAPATDADVMVLDSLGELAGLYRAADVVFVGGSLAPWGGHNVIEPAAAGKPVLFGPHMANFQEIADAFTGVGAAIQISGSTELVSALERLFAEPGLRASMGARARTLAIENRGAAEKTIAVARRLLARS
jgi:3-deoxy-D-manno-octulosonic-acid transferase